MPVPRRVPRLRTLPLWVRRSLGAAYGYAVFLVVAVPAYVIVALAADYLVNRGSPTGPVPWLHTVAEPAEVGVFLLGVVAAIAFAGYLFVLGARALADALRRLVAGRWTDGVVRSLESQQVDSDGDTRYDWLVEFRDLSGRTHRTSFLTYSFSRRPVTEGTALRVRYREADPANAVAILPGVGPWVGHWLSSVVLLVLWGVFVASLPVALAVAGVRWLVGRV